MVDLTEVTETVARQVWEQRGGDAWEGLSPQAKATLKGVLLPVIASTATEVERAVRQEVAIALEEMASRASYKFTEEVTDTYLDAAKIARGAA